MVLDKSVYSDTNYWEGGKTGVKLAWGYTGQNGYLESLQKNTFDGDNDTFAYASALKPYWDKLAGQTFTNAKILLLGGAVGEFADLAKHFGVGTVDVLDISTWCQANVLPTVDNFFLGDMVTLLQDNQQFKNNYYNVTISKQSLECLTDAELATVIPEINRTTKNKQVHIFSNPDNLNQATKNQNAYNAKTLAEWALMGFESGTILVDITGNEVVV
jgi:hypothetical protein